MFLYSDDDMSRLRRRCELDAFSPAWRALERTAITSCLQQLAIPREGAGWYHNYFCPEHATQLSYDPQQPLHHCCPIDGRCYEGEQYDSAWRYLVQCDIVKGLYAAALSWAATGKSDYLTHAAGVLSSYADVYPSYMPHGEHAGQGWCMGQSLDEAVWAISLAQAYDIVRETQPTAWRAHVEQHLLRPIADHLTGQVWRSIHNIECWHLAGLATLAVVLEDEHYLAPVLDPQTGILGQCTQGVREDGWWYEGSPHYHFYTVNAMLALLLALRHRHPEYLYEPRLKAMLDAPLAAAHADLSLPALNDGWYYVSNPGHMISLAANYELAWTLWGDDAYRAFLSRAYADPSQRTSSEALLFGPEIESPSSVMPKTCCLQAASGYAIFRNDNQSAEQWLLYKFGPHGGGHGHFDKLSLELHAFGERLSPDLGTPGYGIPLNASWYRHTLAHNTILLDETAQPEGEGTVLDFSNDTAAGFAAADACMRWGDVEAVSYQGALLRRVILWKTTGVPYFLDMVFVDAPNAQMIDLAWHHRGALHLSGLQPATWSPTNESYALLHDVQQFSAREWTASWSLGTVGSTYWAWDEAHTTLYAASAPANPASETMSQLLRRAQGFSASYIALIEPWKQAPIIEHVHWQGNLTHDSLLRVQVIGDNWEDNWLVGDADRLPADDGRSFRYALRRMSPEMRNT